MNNPNEELDYSAIWASESCHIGFGAKPYILCRKGFLPLMQRNQCPTMKSEWIGCGVILNAFLRLWNLIYSSNDWRRSGLLGLHDSFTEEASTALKMAIDSWGFSEEKHGIANRFNVIWITDKDVTTLINFQKKHKPKQDNPSSAKVRLQKIFIRNILKIHSKNLLILDKMVSLNTKLEVCERSES